MSKFEIAVPFGKISIFYSIFSFIATPAAAAAKSLQSCPTPCDPMDCGPPGSSVHAIFQALVLEWGVIAFSTATPSIFLFMVFLPHRASLVAQTGKTLPAMQETQVQSLNQEDPLENRMATHSNISAWRIPWTEEPGGLQSVGSQRVRHDWELTLSFTSPVDISSMSAWTLFSQTHKEVPHK